MPWEALTGVVEWWADEGLRDRGRLRFQAARGAPASGEPMPPGTIDRVVAAFAARREPWRFAEVCLAATASAAPAVAAWADDAAAVLAGRPARLVRPEDHWGDLGVRRMLQPAAVLGLAPGPPLARLQIPGAALERDLSVAPELVSLGTDRYDAAYDSRLGIVTAWAAVIDGEVVQRVALTELTAIDADASPVG